jgi:transcriptional regulator GlxA family with amidase domain
VPETAGSALYGMVDVLVGHRQRCGKRWCAPSDRQRVFDVRIVRRARPFSCGNGIPVRPDCAVADDPPDIVILPELWLGPDESVGPLPGLIDWVRRPARAGAWLYSACSGAVMLAETGLLDGCDATSHWGYEDLFRRATRRCASGPSRPRLRGRPAGASSPPAARPPGTTWRCTSSRATPAPAKRCASPRCTC